MDICYFSPMYIIYQKSKSFTLLLHKSIIILFSLLIFSIAAVWSIQANFQQLKLSYLTFTFQGNLLSPSFFLGKEHLIPFPHPPECSPFTKYTSIKIFPHNYCCKWCFIHLYRISEEKPTEIPTPLLLYPQRTSHKTKRPNFVSAQSLGKNPPVCLCHPVCLCLESWPLPKLQAILKIWS